MSLLTFTLLLLLLVVFFPALRSTFNISLSQQMFPALWKQAAVVPVLEEGKKVITDVSSFLTIFPNAIHDHVCRYFKHKLNSSQHGFSKSTVTNPVSFIDFVIHFVYIQHQVYAVYFYFISPFDLVPHTVLI